MLQMGLNNRVHGKSAVGKVIKRSTYAISAGCTECIGRRFRAVAAIALLLVAPVSFSNIPTMCTSATAEEPTAYPQEATTARKAGDRAENSPSLAIVQIRDEVFVPDGSTSVRIDDYSGIVKDAWYHSADASYRLRIPLLHSGKITILRRRWENPDGTDVKFVDEGAYAHAVLSVDPHRKPAAEKLRQKYAEYFATKNTKYEADVITTRFDETVQVVAMNWISTQHFPYDPPVIDVSDEKMAKIGPTVGIKRVFWRNGTQYGLTMIVAVESASGEDKAFQLAKREIKKLSDGLEFSHRRP